MSTGIQDSRSSSGASLSGRRESTPGPSRGRLASLDGLRGVVALVVVLHHSLMTHPAIAQAMLRPREHVEVGSLTWFLTRTPGYVLMAGHEAVFIFFILSGLVLTLPRLKPNPEPWRAYYPARLVRLYVPVIAAVLLAAVIFQLVPRHIVASDGVWLNHAAMTYPVGDMLRDMALLGFVSGAVSPLWSLTYEMWFSLLLPLYVWAGRRWPKAPWSLLVATLLLLAASTVQGSASPLFRLQYLASFALGVVIAVRLPQIQAWIARAEKSAGGRAGLVVLLVLGLLLVALRQELQGLGVDILVAERFDFLVAVGCAIVLVLTTLTVDGRRILETRLVQGLGVISFSLYLVHEPLVIAVHELLRGQPWWLVPAVSIPVSLLVAAIFRRAAEQPSHSAARRLRARMRAKELPKA